MGKLLINKKGKIEIDSQIKSKFWPVRMREKQKSRLITSNYSENMPFLMQKSFLAILLAMLISRKPIQTRGICEKNAVFSLLAGRHQRVKESYQFVSNWPFFS